MTQDSHVCNSIRCTFKNKCLLKKYVTPTFSERDHDQSSVHENRVRQVLRHSHWLGFTELYKTDTWGHRQGRVTGRKYRHVVQRIQTRRINTSSPSCHCVSSGRTNFILDSCSLRLSLSAATPAKDLLKSTQKVKLHLYVYATTNDEKEPSLWLQAVPHWIHDYIVTNIFYCSCKSWQRTSPTCKIKALLNID